MAWRLPAIGELREVITLQQPLQGLDEQGGLAPVVPLSAGQEWARVEEYESGEESADGTVRLRRRIAVTIHARSDVRQTWTLRWDEWTWQIEALVRDPAGAWLRLICVAVEGTA